MQRAATTRSRESTIAVAAAETPSSRSPTEVAQRSSRIWELLPEPRAGRLRHGFRLFERAAHLELLDVAIRERQQQLPGGSDPQRERPPS